MQVIKKEFIISTYIACCWYTNIDSRHTPLQNLYIPNVNISANTYFQYLALKFANGYKADAKIPITIFCTI